MFKVCGVTFDKTMNYGSCFQAFALQTVIEKQEIKHERCQYALLPLQKKLLPSKPGVRGIRDRIAGMMRVMFSRFENKYMHYANCDSLAKTDTLNDDYDVFVCGSDVIWSPQFNRNSDAYYLKFANKYAFSYAASFGRARLSKEEIAKLPGNLSKLRSIGVREVTGQQIIKEYTNRESTVVLDPVLLLDREQWDEITEPGELKRPYIFVYCTHFTTELTNFVNRLKAQTHYRVLTVTTGFVNSLKAKTTLLPTPQKWLQLIKQAEYVVTNSFHATAFSVLYHKKFFTVMQGEKSGGINVRMHDFLREIGLSERLYNSVPEFINTDEIDYTGADEILKKLREKSIDFIRDNLEADYKEKQESERKE